METPDTLCMLVSKLLNGVTDRWKRKALMLRGSQQRESSLKDFIEFFDEEMVGGLNFQNFQKMEGSDFSHKKGEVGEKMLL